MKVLLESVATIKDSKINGIALTPTTSLNGNNYLPDVIDSAQNTNVWINNLNLEHDTAVQLGQVKFTVDPKTHTMYYEGNISADKKSQIQEGTQKVSIEAHVDEVAKTCSPKICYNTPMTLFMEGLAVTSNPSVQTTTMNVIESVEQLEKLLVKEDVDVDGSAGQAKVDHKFKPSKDNPNICEVCGKDEDDHMTKESEEITKLQNEVKELRKIIDSSLICKTCGGVKKHG